LIFVKIAWPRRLVLGARFLIVEQSGKEVGQVVALDAERFSPGGGYVQRPGGAKLIHGD
jgi:hypothetical protein